MFFHWQIFTSQDIVITTVAYLGSSTISKFANGEVVYESPISDFSLSSNVKNWSSNNSVAFVYDTSSRNYNFYKIPIPLGSGTPSLMAQPALAQSNTAYTISGADMDLSATFTCIALFDSATFTRSITVYRSTISAGNYTWASVATINLPAQTGGNNTGSTGQLKFSPDGVYLAINVFGGTYIYSRSVNTFTLVSGTQPKLSGGNSHGLAWSPNQSFLARGGVVNNVGTWTNVTFTGGSSGVTAWQSSFSPNGTYFIVTGVGSTANIALYKITGTTFNLRSTASEQETKGGSSLSTSPSWSPDSQIVITQLGSIFTIVNDVLVDISSYNTGNTPNGSIFQN